MAPMPLSPVPGDASVYGICVRRVPTTWDAPEVGSQIACKRPEHHTSQSAQTHTRIQQISRTSTSFCSVSGVQPGRVWIDRSHRVFDQKSLGTSLNQSRFRTGHTTLVRCIPDTHIPQSITIQDWPHHTHLVYPHTFRFLRVLFCVHRPHTYGTNISHTVYSTHLPTSWSTRSTWRPSRAAQSY